MLPDELAWLNRYHRHVYEELSPLLGPEDREWLREATKALSECRNVEISESRNVEISKCRNPEQ